MTQRYGFCVYCGRPTSSQAQPPKPVTCKACRDLLCHAAPAASLGHRIGTTTATTSLGEAKQ